MEKFNIKNFLIIIISILLIIFLEYFLLTKFFLINEKYNKQNIKIQQSNKDIFEEYYEEAETILEKMTLEEKINQMFLVHYSNNVPINDVKENSPGGYILFAKDFENKTKEEIKNELKNIQENNKIKLLLAVDEEGGSVVRVSKYTNFRETKFKSPQELYALGGLQAIIEDSQEKTKLLKEIGINFNLVPVVDISTDSNSFIYNRTLGKDVYETAKYASSLIQTMNSDNIISCLKHFPGYGDNLDTHKDISIDERDLLSFYNYDFIPFIKAIESGAPCILVNHNIVTCLDDKNPASLSKNVNNILREKLNFTGIIITDDLGMNAINNYLIDESAAVKAILAGNDILISSNFKKQKEEVLNAVIEGKILEEIINKAVIRIIAMKYKYKIIR